MNVLPRKVIAAISTSILISSLSSTAVAQSSFSGSTQNSQSQPTLEASQEPGIKSDAVPAPTIDGPFAQWGIPTPPGAEDYVVNQATEEELNPQGLEEWHPTSNPNSEVIPGQMRSDREEIPAKVEKSEADQAETREAQLAAPDSPALYARRGCSVYWPISFEVCGLIKEKYDSIGGPTSFLLLPKSNELTNPDGVGKRSEFVNGFIYWHPTTGAHTVSLPVSKVWERHGWEGGFLGYPTTSDITLGNAWYKQDFQGGHVYTHNTLPLSQASIQGAIYDKWQSMGAQNSELGYPISDELTTPDGIGRYNVFEGGMIYWTPKHGAHSVSGGILFSWATQGYERSAYGYPIGDVFINNQGRQEQNFEGGVLYGDPNVFWQPFSCLHAVSRISQEMGILDRMQFMCSNRGVSITANGLDYFGMPTVEDVAKNIPIPELWSARDSTGMTGVECDFYESGSMSGPFRKSDYKAVKKISFCFGETDPPSPFENIEPRWSREFAWTVSDSLIQRAYGDLAVSVENLDLPSFTFQVNSRLRKDISRRFDYTTTKSTNTVTAPGLSNADKVTYDILKEPGTYFTEIDGISLQVPEWGYNQSFGGYRFAIGRYDCPEYSHHADLCKFTNPIDDHT
ncbi:LGFP repeat-containing protein [Corynebacterium sp. BF-R-2]|uniref:LGFP repeat-containing protein n=1 Tax=Corynebacterium sp. BF-R-2 TaxID=2943494 RepID=UPI00211DDADF|nr:hypothetical protein [Corynebacterium sp. BF-R-2]MCQ9677918.1 hypothetical protein [Corynebacterium sp. BF-R-2]